MELTTILPIIIDILVIILIIVFTILGIKCIKLINKAQTIIDDVEDKINKLNTVFNIFDTVSDYFGSLGNKVVGTVKRLITRYLNKSKKTSEEEELERIMKEEN